MKLAEEALERNDKQTGWVSISVTFTWTERVGGVQVVSLGPIAPTSWGILFLMVLPREDIRGLVNHIKSWFLSDSHDTGRQVDHLSY